MSLCKNQFHIRRFTKNSKIGKGIFHYTSATINNINIKKLDESKLQLFFHNPRSQSTTVPTVIVNTENFKNYLKRRNRSLKQYDDKDHKHQETTYYKILSLNEGSPKKSCTVTLVNGDQDLEEVNFIIFLNKDHEQFFKFSIPGRTFSVSFKDIEKITKHDESYILNFSEKSRSISSINVPIAQLDKTLCRRGLYVRPKDISENNDINENQEYVIGTIENKELGKKRLKCNASLKYGPEGKNLEKVSLRLSPKERLIYIEQYDGHGGKTHIVSASLRRIRISETKDNNSYELNFIKKNSLSKENVPLKVEAEKITLTKYLQYFNFFINKKEPNEKVLPMLTPESYEIIPPKNHAYKRGKRH